MMFLLLRSETGLASNCNSCLRIARDITESQKIITLCKFLNMIESLFRTDINTRTSDID
jgi:hypothetical protein